jgi:SAM-dependent methyltransferase
VSAPPRDVVYPPAVAARPEIAVVGGAVVGDRRLPWWSELAPPPASARAVDDRITAREALRHVRSGEALAWGGDWQNARQLLAAMRRRLPAPRPRGPGAAAAFRAEREAKRVEQAVLMHLAVPVGPGWESPLRRAPPLGAPLGAAWGTAPERTVLVPLREILGAMGAYQWYLRGVHVPALGGLVHPAYGVFAPVRGEYVDLVAQALARRGDALELARAPLAFDVGTGTGVLAVLVARAGARVIATDIDPRAVASARENAARLGAAERVEVVEADLFPPGRARLVVANPPWIPEEPLGTLDRAVYDPGGTVLARLVEGLATHLDERGEAWLVLSDLAELIGLRPAGAVERLARTAGLRVVARLSTAAAHPRARSTPGPLGAARAAERTTLHVLAPAPR